MTATVAIIAAVILGWLRYILVNVPHQNYSAQGGWGTSAPGHTYLGSVQIVWFVYELTNPVARDLLEIYNPLFLYETVRLTLDELKSLVKSQNMARDKL